MRRPFVTLAAAALAAFIGGAALAAEAATQPDQLRAEKLIGSAVYDRQNQDIGSVKDLVLAPDGRIAAVVVLYGSIGGIGGKYVAVDFGSVKFDKDRLTLDQTRAQLSALPPYRLNSGADGQDMPLIIGLGQKAK
jgi:sporulation protein YlmC with PRC-barrel domain